MSNEILDSGASPNDLIREDLVKTAVSFLQNPKVRNTPLAQKQKFLQRKGLTDKEIQEACQLSGAYLQHETQLNIPPPLPPSNRNLTQLSFFYKLREFLHNVAIVSVVGYVLYKIYENYIAPFLFGKKKKTVEDSIEALGKDLEKSVENLKISIEDTKGRVSKMDYQFNSTHVQELAELKREVASVKGLLLGRKQFPSVSNSPVVPPSIPAWQMSSVPDASDGDNDQKIEESEEVGSGTSSSEHEHCTKTSESSLEILSTRECESATYQGKSEEV